MIRKLSTAQKTIERYEYLYRLAYAYAEKNKPNNDDSSSYNKWSLSHIRWEDGSFIVNWSRYLGCGDYDHETTYFGLESLFTGA